MAKVEWEIKGRLSVEDNATQEVLFPGSGVGNPNGGGNQLLRNVKIKIEASTQKQKKMYSSWGEITTDSLGNFSIKKMKDEKPRHVRIYIILNNSKLRVIGQHTLSEKLVIYESDGRVSGPVLDIGDFVIFGSPGVRNVPLPTHKKVLAWYICDCVLETFAGKGPEFKFKRKLHVKVDASPIFKASWARGLGMSIAYVIKLDGGDFFITLLHEIMHIWNYQHNSGTTNWLAHLNSKEIDGVQQYEPYVAFHEGFAEYAAYEIAHHLFGRVKLLPFSRRHLVEVRSLDTIKKIERDAYNGVVTCLRMLTAEKPGQVVTKGSVSSTFARLEDRKCDAQQLMDFWDVLRTFSPGPNWKTEWQVGNRDYGVFRFFDRAIDLNERVTREKIDALVQVLDPTTGYETFSFCDVLSSDSL